MGVATTSGVGTSLGSLQLREGIAGGDSLPITATGSDLSSVRLTAELGTGTLGPFWPAQPLTASQVPVRGSMRLCLIFGCGYHIPLPLDVASGQSGLGVGGFATAGGGTTFISLEFAPWTVGTISASFETTSGEVVNAVTNGWVHGPSSFAGSTALTGGELSVVTPVRVTSNSELGQRSNSLARLQIRFVPEPGPWLLLVSGVVGLALLGRSRMR